MKGSIHRITIETFTEELRALISLLNGPYVPPMAWLKSVNVYVIDQANELLSDMEHQI